MSEARRPYVRIYYNDLIRDYPGVWSDDAQLALWVRLLALADPMWPTPPELPRSTRPKALANLVKSTLVALDGIRFRIKGMDAERNARSNAGRIAAASRWHSDRNADAMPIPSPSPRPSPRQAEQPAGDRDSLDTYHELTGFRPWGIWSGDKLRGAMIDYGDAKLDAALRAEWTAKPNRVDLLDRTFARLAKDAERAKQAAKERPKPKPAPVDNDELQRVRRELSKLPEAS